MILFLFLLLFLLSILCFFSLKTYELKLYAFVVIGLILALAAGFREGWADYINYANGYYSVIKNDLVSFEITFVFISKFVYLLVDNVLGLFIIYSILGVSLKLIAIKQLTSLWFLSIIIYLGTYYILHELIQIRVGVAAGFLLLTIKPIYDRNFKKFLFFFICAFLFHYSALIIFPLWFLNKNKPRKTLLYLAIPVGYLIYFSNIDLISEAIPIPAIKQKILHYKTINQVGLSNIRVNVFNLLIICQILIYYVFLWKFELLRKKNNYFILLMKIYALSLFVYPTFAILPVVAQRVNELYGVVTIILYPLLIYTSKPKVLAKIVVILIGLVLLSVSIFYSKNLFNN